MLPVWKMTMPDYVDQNEIQIDRTHGGEFRMEIGERLAVVLGQPPKALPGGLRALIDQLAKGGPDEAPLAIEAGLDL